MGKTVNDLMTDRFIKINEVDPIYEAATRITESKERMIACVVDRDDKLIGIITPREILKAVEVRWLETVSYPLFGPEVLHILTSRYARDIMSAPLSVRAGGKLEEAIKIMLDEELYEVPVVDSKGRVIGEISYFNIISAAINHLKE